MGQDLRKLFEKERDSKKYALKGGHEERFLGRLESSLPERKRSTSFFWIQIAATVVVLVGIGSFFFLGDSPDIPVVKTTVVDKPNTDEPITGISLGDISPELEKVENYYVANINYEISQLDVSTDNKEMVDGFMERLAELDVEYNTLTTELNELGPNDETISALIQNLQLRLQLLQKLKEKLNQLKSSKNEQENHII